MKWFSFFALWILIVIFAACSDAKKASPSDAKSHVTCPQCHMPVGMSNKYSSKIESNNEKYIFDDIGCMVLFAQNKGLDFSIYRASVFTKDTQKFIPIYKARYKMNEKTPMSYGFVAYELKDDEMIVFDELRLKMLRGEHMANPKIRKKVLGV